MNRRYMLIGVTAAAGMLAGETLAIARTVSESRAEASEIATAKYRSWRRKDAVFLQHAPRPHRPRVHVQGLGSRVRSGSQAPPARAA
jgi:hypothetical protein